MTERGKNVRANVRKESGAKFCLFATLKEHGTYFNLIVFQKGAQDLGIVEYLASGTLWKVSM